jgi:hypothetical protein
MFCACAVNNAAWATVNDSTFFSAAPWLMNAPKVPHASAYRSQPHTSGSVSPCSRARTGAETLHSVAEVGKSLHRYGKLR